MPCVNFPVLSRATDQTGYGDKTQQSIKNDIYGIEAEKKSRPHQLNN